MDQPVPIDGPVAENVFGAGSSIVLGALGIFDGLRVFNNRDTDGACLALSDVCTLAPGSVGSLYYAACLAFENRASRPIDRRARAGDRLRDPGTLARGPPQRVKRSNHQITK